MKEVTIRLKDETYERLKEITDLENLINRHRDKNRRDDYQMEEFIVGCIIDKMEQINDFGSVHPSAQKGTRPLIKNRFKEIAKEKNMYIKDIAAQLEVQAPNLSKIFNNASQPRLDLFVKIWVVLGCPPLQRCIYLERD
ncbi:helix-turn-helix domain-containing protein [Virgibacillus xinjiangensis]|uniref:Helix-turn-helix domain-containing protein n=1 Tax=Virgibacillus xinjiangensis TaxID=393090 RepID=A0ABV7CWE5_9BACI